MFFKSNNFTFKDHTKIPFDVIFTSNSEINNIVSNKSDIYFSQLNYIYKLRTNKKNKCQNTVTSLESFDNLLVAGDDSGNIKLFSNNIQIKSFNEHKNRINQFEMYKNVLISCSDDGTIRFFSFEKNHSIKIIDCFTDRIRCLKIDNEVLYCGLMNGYIYGVSLKSYEIEFEKNCNTAIFNISIVECSIIFTSYNKIYKINKKNILEHLGSHTKNITALKIIKNRIYTVGLDGFFKSWTINGKLISQISLGSSITGFSLLETTFYFSLETGQICKIESYKKEQQVNKIEIKNKKLKEYESEIKYKTFEQDFYMNNEIEKLIKKFEHKGALLYVLSKNNFKDIFSVLYYLQQEHKIKNALLFLEKNYIYLLLDFIINNIHIKELFEVFFEVINILLSVYFYDIYDDNNIFERFILLSELIDEEVIFQEKIIELYSFIECFKC